MPKHHRQHITPIYSIELATSASTGNGTQLAPRANSNYCTSSRQPVHRNPLPKTFTFSSGWPMDREFGQLPTMTRESMKENNKPAGIKSFINVLRPIRDWLNMKSSTPISAQISHPHLSLHQNNGSGNNQNPQLQQQLQQQPPQRQHSLNIIGSNHNSSSSSSSNNLSQHLNRNQQNNINTPNNSNSNNHINNHSSNSYGESLTGLSSADMLSSVAPTPIQRYTPIVNGNGMMTMDDLNGSAGGMSSLENQFCRNASARMSLPIMQQNKMRRQAYSQLQRRGQHLPRSLGHIYLQHKGETKQANLPNELTTIDTIRALFVCAFPHMLSMEYMSQPHVKIYIYSPSCNIFYELCDIEEVKHESVLRIHHSDPLIPLALPSQVTAAPTMGHYATIHRLPPRVPPPQLHPPAPPMPPSQQQHLMQQQMLAHHQQQLHIPPPKPRRMIPASYSMHRLNPQ